MWVSEMGLPAEAGHARCAARHKLAGMFLSVATTMAAMLATVPAQAQIDATWSANPAAGNNFNDPGNWVPPTAVPTGTASFGPTTANGTIPTITLPTTVAGINFLSSAPRYNFAVTNDLTISGASGITNSSGLSQNFVVLPPATMLFQSSTTGTSATAFGNRGGTLVFNNSSAGAANIENQVSGSGATAGNVNFVNGRASNAIISNDFGSATITFSGSSNADSATLNNSSSGGTIVFGGTSNAGNATITNFVAGSSTTFQGTSSAGSATVTANSGTTVNFTSSSSGSQGRFIVNSGGVLDISALSGTSTTSGSIEGAGSFLLGSKQFTTGLNNLSTTVSGVIADGGAAGGAGGSLVKTGGGTLTLTGQNTYTGGTTIRAGIPPYKRCGAEFNCTAERVGTESMRSLSAAAATPPPAPSLKGRGSGSQRWAACAKARRACSHAAHSAGIASQPWRKLSQSLRMTR
jgi:autotransporter-associated beta strand protein